MTMVSKVSNTLRFSVLACAVLGSACKSEPVATTSGSVAPSGQATAAAAPGDLVVGSEIVVVRSANSFTGGTATAIAGTKVMYDYGDPDATTKKRQTSSADKAQAFVLGAAPKTPVKVGDFVIAKSTSGSWFGCEVKTAEASILGCEDSYGKINNTDPKSVVAPDGVTSANIKQALTSATKERVFDAAAAAAGKPAAPKGWTPKAADMVAVEWMTNKWHAASVVSVDGANVTIKWDNGVWKNDVKSLAAIVPAPKVALAVNAGQFVLVHVGNEWTAHKVVSATKTTAEVVDKNDKQTTVKLADVLLVGG